MNAELIRTSFFELLPDKAIERIIEFANMKQGWDGTAGQTLCEKSVAGCITYLTLMVEKGYCFIDTDEPHHRVSVFMNNLGQLELNWYDQNWTLVHLTFISDKQVEVFLATPNRTDKTITLKVNAPNVPYYTIKNDTKLASKAQAFAHHQHA